MDKSSPSLVQALIDLGWLELEEAASAAKLDDVLEGALERGLDSEGMIELLVARPEVAEVYASDDEFEGFLEKW